MKFIHIADVHLGARPDAGPMYSAGRAQELWDTFRGIISLCEEERTDLLLIAGDLFDKNYVTRDTIALLRREFAKLDCPVPNFPI